MEASAISTPKIARGLTRLETLGTAYEQYWALIDPEVGRIIKKGGSSREELADLPKRQAGGFVGDLHVFADGEEVDTRTISCVRGRKQVSGWKGQSVLLFRRRCQFRTAMDVGDLDPQKLSLMTHSLDFLHQPSLSISWHVLVYDGSRLDAALCEHHQIHYELFDPQGNTIQKNLSLLDGPG